MAADPHLTARDHHAPGGWVAAVVVASAVLSVAWCVTIARRGVTAGSLKAGSTYPWLAHVKWWGLLTAWLGAALLVIAGRAALRFGTRRGVLLLYVAALPVQLLLRAPVTASLGAIVQSDAATSFYTVTLHYRPADLLAHFRSIAPGLALHARTNMPGKELLFYLLELVPHTPTTLALGVFLMANVGAVGAHMVVHEASGRRDAAIRAMQLWILTPGMVAFLPVLNAVSCVPIVFALWCLLRFVRRPAWTWGLAIGLLVFVGLEFEPLPLTAGIVFLVVLGWRVTDHSLPPGRAVGLALTTIAGFAVSVLVWWGVTREWVLGDLAYVLADAKDFNARASRPYRTWVFVNLRDFVWCAGVLPICLAIAAVMTGISRARRMLPAPVIQLAAGTLATLAVVDALGVDRGETIRLWIFLANLLTLPAGWLLADSRGRWAPAAALGLVATQAALQVMLALFVNP